tara:strand:+ start:142 stop:501 length:360 start_codon:yes stop_codon:yes gene_type:complete
MPSITITFEYPINESVSVNDTAYYLPTTSAGAPNAHGPQTDIVEMGTITAMDRVNNTITCNIGTYVARPVNDSFILFSKDNRANMSSLAGYYAEVKMENTDNTSVELYSVGSEIVESSK